MFEIPKCRFNDESIAAVAKSIVETKLFFLFSKSTWLWHRYLGIESHFVGVHGPYELHQKEKQIFIFFPMQFIWPVNTDKMRFNTYIYIF